MTWVFSGFSRFYFGLLLLLLLLLELSSAATVTAPLHHDVCDTDAQCLNGGNCQVVHRGEIKSGNNDNDGSMYNYCHCLDGFGGQRCEQYCPLSCQNHGVCHRLNTVQQFVLPDPKHPHSDQFACKCYGLWMGTVCDIPYENCGDGRQCLNGGVCRYEDDDDQGGISSSSSSSSSYCECPQTFDGPTCADKLAVSATTTGQQKDHPRLKGLLAKFDESNNYIGAIALAGVLCGLALGLFVYQRYYYQACFVVQQYDSLEHDREFQVELQQDVRYNHRTELQQQSEQWRNII